MVGLQVGTRAAFAASGTLLLACVCALPANGARQQGSTATSPAKKSAPTKSSAATTATKAGKVATPHKSRPVAKSAASKTSGKSTVAHSAKHSSHKKSTRVRGQQKIDSERARSIQEALIREHYLSGEPSGAWNQESEDAMRRYQGDHGWQTKEVPDSRALIKLGLGPSHDHLLNPESAMTTSADVPRTQSSAPTSNSPAPVVPASTPTQSDPAGPQ